MGTRTSFRPRPVDVNKPLPVVRDLSELDSQDGANGDKPQDVKVRTRKLHAEGHRGQRVRSRSRSGERRTWRTRARVCCVRGRARSHETLVLQLLG